MKFMTRIPAAVSLISALCLQSCVWQYFMRDEYSGTAPHVIADNNGKPASQAWLSIPEDALPASLAEQRDSLSYGAAGIPYGFRSGYKDIVISPYAPHRYLNYSGVPTGSRVWDPYNRKPFYIPSSYTLN